jgi:hypothetical protein
VGERGCPSGGILLSMRKINFEQETFQKTKNCVSQGNDFISPMQKSMTSSFTIGLMESNKQELDKLPPWGCNHFYFPRKVSLARV